MHSPKGTTRWRRVGAIGAVLLAGSAMPLPDSPRPRFGRFGPDKLLHLLGHAGFAAALDAALVEENAGRRSLLIAVGVSTLYGLGTELLQERVPGREFERDDVLAGAVGAVLGAVGYHRRAGPLTAHDAVPNGVNLGVDS